MIIYYISSLAIDVVRAIFGPLNDFVCTFGVFIKNVVPINASLITLSMTITKFVFVFIYKSIPCMEDNFLSFFIYLTINMISILSTFSRLYLPGRPIFNKVLLFFIEIKINHLCKLPCFFLSLYYNKIQSLQCAIVYQNCWK